MFLDYSKNRMIDETLNILIQLAEESGLRARIDAMFHGERINVTENRSVLHVALRAPKGESIVVDGENIVPKVHTLLGKMNDICNRVRSGELEGLHGSRIRNVANIGIGVPISVPACGVVGKEDDSRGLRSRDCPPLSEARFREGLAFRGSDRTELRKIRNVTWTSHCRLAGQNSSPLEGTYV
jgi:Phosphoglucose isomerase